jgi:hypothetical protein
MPLSAAFPGLINDIKTAYEDAMTNGDKQNATPDTVIATLALDMATAIDAYVTSALVITDAGQMVQTAVVTAGSPSAQAGTGTGATSASGTGSLS